jgi:hypothetical protein
MTLIKPPAREGIDTGQIGIHGDRLNSGPAHTGDEILKALFGGFAGMVALEGAPRLPVERDRFLGYAFEVNPLLNKIFKQLRKQKNLALIAS